MTIKIDQRLKGIPGWEVVEKYGNERLSEKGLDNFVVHIRLADKNAIKAQPQEKRVLLYINSNCKEAKGIFDPKDFVNTRIIEKAWMMYE